VGNEQDRPLAQKQILSDGAYRSRFARARWPPDERSVTAKTGGQGSQLAGIKAGRINRRRGAGNRRVTQDTITDRIACTRKSLNALNQFAHQVGQIALKASARHDRAKITRDAQGNPHPIDGYDEHFLRRMPLNVQIAWGVAGKIKQILNVERILVAAANLRDPPAVD